MEDENKHGVLVQVQLIVSEHCFCCLKRKDVEKNGCLVSAANSFGPLSGLAAGLMALELTEDCSDGDPRERPVNMAAQRNQSENTFDVCFPMLTLHLTFWTCLNDIPGMCQKCRYTKSCVLTDLHPAVSSGSWLRPDFT